MSFGMWPLAETCRSRRLKKQPRRMKCVPAVPQLEEHQCAFQASAAAKNTALLVSSVLKIAVEPLMHPELATELGNAASAALTLCACSAVCMARQAAWVTMLVLSVVYENRPPVSMSEDHVYQSLDAADMDPDQTYSTLTETANM
ncbi:hypothetical protein L3Q82_005309 [Scomber scombrus]|uniref:Uncharacterized protein n=1 Tax=Scomber scombrus TaxID=13677 RepID=A0AAV1QC02_SCOSC